MKKMLVIAALLALAGPAPGQIPTDSLKAYYPFNGNARDTSGYGNHGTLHNGVTLTTDRFGRPNNAYKFDGTDDYITVADAPSLDLTVGATMSIWMKTDINPQNNEVSLIGKGAAFADNYNISIGGTPSNDLRMLSWIGGLAYQLNIDNWLVGCDLDTWYHIVTTFEGSQGRARLYVNGTKLAESSLWPSSLDTGNVELYIGGNPPGVYDLIFSGSLDDIRIYNRALSESEVIALHNSEISLEIAAPQLISPAHETFTNDLSPIFTWHSADTTYWSRLQISFSPTFDSLWHDGLGSDTTQQVGLIGGRYYWRVKDYDGSESSDWSEVRALTVDTTYPYAPVLKGPPDMAWVNGGPGLSWNWAAGVMNCLVQVSADTSFIAIADSATLSDSIYSPSLSDGKYFWRVQSCDSAGNWSGWSEVRRFRLDTYAPRIIATYPVSGQGNVNLSDTVRIIFNEPLVPGSFMYEFSPTVAMVYGGGSASHDTMLLWSDWFQTGTEYTVTISGASDSAGNLLTGGPVPNPWTFTMSTDGVGPEIVHYPAGLPQTAGQPMTVSALVTDPGSGVSAVYLHYRMGGAVDFTALPMAHQGGDSYQADIPGAQVGERGVSYYLRAVDQMGAWSIVPAGAPDQRFHRVVELAVAGPSLAQPARSYRMVSVPFNSPGSPFRPDIFADDLGAYNDTRWRIFRWQSGAYAEYGGVQDIQPGRAYWLITQDSRKIDVDNVHTVADTACHIPLELGWNMVGTPFAYSVYLDEVTVYDGMGGSFGFNDPGNVLTEQQLVYYEGYGYLNVGQLDPWCGYWVRALNSGVTLVVPASAGAGKPALSPQPDGWRLTLSAGINGYHDRENAAGIDPRGAGANASEPPQVDGYVSLAFMNTGRKLAEDYRQEIGQGQSWRFRVGTDQAGTVELGFTEQGQAGGWAYSLYDIAAGRMVPAGGHYSYQSGQGGGARDFVLLAGTPEYIRAEAGRAGLLPAVTLLEQNHPNPFRGRTAISYQLARPGRVDLGVYNLLGQRVRTLAYGMQETGRYTVDWDGRDQAGRLSGSGVYFLRLEADVESCSRRMLLLR